jgi:hypothetical protein
MSQNKHRPLLFQQIPPEGQIMAVVAAGRFCGAGGCGWQSEA